MGNWELKKCRSSDSRSKETEGWSWNPKVVSRGDSGKRSTGLKIVESPVSRVNGIPKGRSRPAAGCADGDVARREMWSTKGVIHSKRKERAIMCKLNENICLNGSDCDSWLQMHLQICVSCEVQILFQFRNSSSTSSTRTLVPPPCIFPPFIHRQVESGAWCILLPPPSVSYLRRVHV